MKQTKILLHAVMATATVAMLAFVATGAQAQKIVCWKDASGKTVGCGDKVPLEFSGSATKELDKQGNVRKTGESAEEVAKRKAQEKEAALAKAEEQKRLKEQKRQDDALLNTFTNEKEIDLKRDRELQALNNFITQQTAALKVANERFADSKKRAETFEKDKKPLPVPVKDDLSRAERDKARIEQDIASKEKEKGETTTKYAEYRRRFMELKGVTSSPVPAVAAPTSAPAPASASATAPPAAAAPAHAKK